MVNLLSRENQLFSYLVISWLNATHFVTDRKSYTDHSELIFS